LTLESLLTLEKLPSRQSIPVRSSACPGLLRIVAALDGGICRVKLPCGQLSAAQAVIVADVAARCGSAIIEITNRANLQIRGVRADRANELIEALLAAGLGPDIPGADDVRNLMVSPSAGIDTDAIVDIVPLAENILALLQTQPRFQELSPKFAVLLDGGERLARLEHPHDLWLSAIPGTSQFVFGLAGCPARNGALAAVLSSNVVELTAAVLHTFLDLAAPAQTRMRHLLQTISTTEFLQQVQRRLPFALVRDVSGWQQKPAKAFAHIGAHPQQQSGLSYVGAVPQLGRLQAPQLRELAHVATTHGTGALRLTPWQSILLPNIPDAATEIVLSELQRLEFSTRVDDPLAHIIACTGSQGCAKGLADTKADALQLAELLQKNSIYPDVHVTGCARSCAAADIAPFTLLAVAEGRYDLFRRDAAQSGFGKLIASAVDIASACDVIENTLTQSPLPAGE
jgi:precorrin-3B synthase